MEEPKQDEAEQNRTEREQKKQRQSELQKLEQQAAGLRAEGKRIAALERLEEAINLDKKWYHFRCKAEWNKEINRPDKAAAAIDDGLKLDNSLAQLFWLVSWNANFLLRTRLNPNEALRQLIQAENILYNQLELVNVHGALYEVSEPLRWANPELLSASDIKTFLVSLRSEIQSANYTVSLFTQIKDVERKIDSERVRTIELLGIFTAIFAFIFSGVQIFTRLQVGEALVLEAGMALLLITFFLGFHMVIKPEARTKGLIALLVFLVIILLVLPLYAGFLRNTLDFERKLLPNITQQKINSSSNN